MVNERKFPVGFWNYAPVGMYGPEAVKDWTDCGMTLTMTPGYNPAHHRKEDLTAIMDECEKQGIRLIICDSRTGWHGAHADMDAYRRRFESAYEDFGRHPAAFGFHIGDEPVKKDNENCYAAYNIQREMAPELTPFLNFMPHWKGEYLGFESFEAWADEFIPKVNLKLLCYDRYSQMNPEEQGTDQYFSDLHSYYSISKSLNVPFWTTLLSVGHFRYRCPKEDDLRWQFNTAVASGCKGILWFFFYMRAPHSNYRLAPIDEHGERTETYHWLSRVLRTFHKTYGDLFLDLELTRSFHVGKAYGGFPLFEENMHKTVKNAVCLHGINGIVSFFKDRAGKEYIAVVNNSPYISGQVTLELSKESISRFVRIGWNRSETDSLTHHHDEGFSESEGLYAYSPWLAPGQMNLYRLEEK